MHARGIGGMNEDVKRRQSNKQGCNSHSYHNQLFPPEGHVSALHRVYHHEWSHH